MASTSDLIVGADGHFLEDATEQALQGLARSRAGSGWSLVVACSW